MVSRRFDRVKRNDCLAFIRALPLTLVGGIVTSSCTSHQRPDDIPYRFAVFGDMPYYASPSAPLPASEVTTRYKAVLAQINDADVAFVVHVGDITSSRVCADSVYEARYEEFQALRHPLFYVFGDNEWTECDRAGLDPLEQLGKLREVFAQGDSSLGGLKWRVERQSSTAGFAKFREHIRWRRGGDLYVGLHIPGGTTDRGTGSEPTEEFVERNRAVIAWLRESFRLARQEDRRSVVLAMQADPWFPRDRWLAGRQEAGPAYDAFLNALQKEVEVFDGPVLLLHGDTHYFRVDKPMSDVTTGHVVENFTRLETFGHPFMHWVLVTVDPADPDLFRARPILVTPR